eukprot:TRINITY_DN15662_c0_g1_i1.p1 TRINITY_DN15662_c0_g1~~TRINITY_DN15662_c0_g1_i1.p1  ORF type:complete len:452 (+),score=86.72 TRINITY_DN15662_c0_g1_i1:59-1414(+)
MSCSLLPEVLLEVFPFLPPQEHGNLCRVSKVWKETSYVTFRQYLAWRQQGKPKQLVGTPVVKTVYHLHGDYCYTLTREHGTFTGETRVIIKKRALSEENAVDLLTLTKTAFCVMQLDSLIVLSTDHIEIRSLHNGSVAHTLYPTEEQRNNGVKFTNIISCSSNDNVSLTKIACKMRPGQEGVQAQVNFYNLTLNSVTLWSCPLKKVRSCQLTQNYLVLKGISPKGIASVVAINVDSGRQFMNEDTLLNVTCTAPGHRKDIALIGVDGSAVAHFVQPRNSKKLPSAWNRWSDRLMRKKRDSKGFEILQWDIKSNKVTLMDLSVTGIPAPAGWPSSEPFSLTLDKDKCYLADHGTVLVCYFMRMSEKFPKGSGIIAIYTKSGHLLSTLDPSSPSLVDAGVHQVSLDFLSADKYSQKLLVSLTHSNPTSIPAHTTKILTHSYEPAPPYLPPGCL